MAFLHNNGTVTHIPGTNPTFADVTAGLGKMGNWLGQKLNQPSPDQWSSSKDTSSRAPGFSSTGRGFGGGATPMWKRRMGIS